MWRPLLVIGELDAVDGEGPGLGQPFGRGLKCFAKSVFFSLFLNELCSLLSVLTYQRWKNFVSYAHQSWGPKLRIFTLEKWRTHWNDIELPTVCIFLVFKGFKEDYSLTWEKFSPLIMENAEIHLNLFLLVFWCKPVLFWLVI